MLKFLNLEVGAKTSQSGYSKNKDLSGDLVGCVYVCGCKLYTSEKHLLECCFGEAIYWGGKITITTCMF